MSVNLIVVAAGLSKILTKEGKPAGCRVPFLRLDLRQRPDTTLVGIGDICPTTDFDLG